MTTSSSFPASTTRHRRNHKSRKLLPLATDAVATTSASTNRMVNGEETIADKNTLSLPTFYHCNGGSSKKKKSAKKEDVTAKLTHDENGKKVKSNSPYDAFVSDSRNGNSDALGTFNGGTNTNNNDDDGCKKSINNNNDGTNTHESSPMNQILKTNIKPRNAKSAKSPKKVAMAPAVEIDLSNSSRHPVFSTHMNDGILLLVASYLEFRDVMSLSRVNKYNFREGLAVDCLFCRNPCHRDDDNGGCGVFDSNKFYSMVDMDDDNSRVNNCGDDDVAGIRRSGHNKVEETLLLPCLHPYKEKLLPAIIPSSSSSSSSSSPNAPPSRPSGLARTFARETVIFSKACEEFDSARNSRRGGRGGPLPGTRNRITNSNNNDNDNNNDATTKATLTMEPKKIINLTTPERILISSFKHVTWTHAYTLKSGIRLSYVTNDNNNSALVTVWSNNSKENEACWTFTTLPSSSSAAPTSSSTSSKSGSSRYYYKERYVPPNTHSILEAAFHSESGLCAILATSLGGGGDDKYSAVVSSSRPSSLNASSPSAITSSNTSGYTLSLIQLPKQPFSRNNAGSLKSHPPIHSSASKNSYSSYSQTSQKVVPLPTQPTSAQSHQHTLKWQKYLSNQTWKLFSSSSTRAIVSFSPQGTHILFGSTETWGLVDVETGSRVWSLFRNNLSMSGWSAGVGVGVGSANTMGMMSGTTPNAAGTPSLSSHATTLPTPSHSGRVASKSFRLASPIDAHLIHRGFLFILQNNGKVLRIYDELDLSCPGEPLAEGDLPWSPSNHDGMAQNVHNNHNNRTNHSHYSNHDSQHRCNQGNNNNNREQDDFQLDFCSGRIWITGTHKKDLLCSTPPRLLRRLRSRNNDSPLNLKFLRIMNDLSVSTPHTMLSWNDTHLYILDSNKVYRWNVQSSNVNSRRKGITTIYSGGNKRVQNFHVDGTKLVICTVNPFWDTRRRIWEGNERMWIVPIDSFGSIFGDSGWTENLAKLRKGGHGDVPFVQRMRDQCRLLEQPDQSYGQMEVFLKKVLPSCQLVDSSVGENDTITDLFLRNVNGFGGESNYHVLSMACDGRFVTLHCERSGGDDVDAVVKLAVFDLYQT